MGNVNDNVFRPLPQATFWPGRELVSATADSIAKNHNFLITRSGHTLVNQAGGGENIANDGTWRDFAYYVVHLHPRGGDVRMTTYYTTGTAGYEFRFTLFNGTTTLTSSTINAASSWTGTIAAPAAAFHNTYLLVTCQIRRTSSAGDVQIGSLVIEQDEVTTNPFTTGPRFYGLDSSQWGTANAAIDVRGVQYAMDTCDALQQAKRHVVTLCAWNNYGLTPAPTVSLGTSGKAGADTRERIVAGLHTGATGRRKYRVFATGRNSAAVTATYTMSIEGYADAGFAFDITNTGSTVFTRGSWPAWNREYNFSVRRDAAAWDMIAEIAATNFTYLQALTIIEDA